MTPSVIIVFDTNFGAQLDALAARAPVWIIQSAGNNQVAGRLRETRGLDISTFLPGTLLDLMSVIDDHHPGWTTIEVYAQDLSTDVRQMLREYGDGKYETSPGRFTFSRSPAGQPSGSSFKYKPLEKAEVEEGLRAEVLELPRQLQQFYRSVAVEVYQTAYAQFRESELLFVVAKSGNRAIFYDDIEEDFGIGTIDDQGALKDCGLIGELRFALIQLQDA